MSVHRRFLSIPTETISKFETIPAGPVETLAELQRDKDAVGYEMLHMLDRHAVEESERPRCPICSGNEFADYNGRAHAICKSCKSLERGRLLHVVLTSLNLPQPNARILHVAPELYLYSSLSAQAGCLYYPCDLNPEHPNYKRLNAKIFPMDLCRDLPGLASDSFDLILHNHVLEHLPCPLIPVLEEHKRILRPGGYFVFTVPFRGEHTDEDISPLSDEQRKRRFGQHDHVRIFGTIEFPEFLKNVFGVDLRFPVEKHWSKSQLAGWGIPPRLAYGLSGMTVFCYHKPYAPVP